MVYTILNKGFYLKIVLFRALEALAVHTLAVGGIVFVRSDADRAERAVVLTVAVVLAVLNSASDAFVYIGSIHCFSPRYYYPAVGRKYPHKRI